MDVTWYIVLSALIFATGVAGVITRRNPLVVLLSLELLLNAGNLALVAFSRMWGNADGQIFALIVMVVAACEVVVGLGLIVAMYRSRIPITLTRCRTPRLTSTGTWGWLILAFPLAGSIIVALGWRTWGGRTAGWLGTSAIALAFASAIGAFFSIQAKTPDERHVVSNAIDYVNIAGVHAKLGHPGRSAGRLHVPDGERRVDADPRLFGRLHGLRPRVRRASSRT